MKRLVTVALGKSAARRKSPLPAVRLPLESGSEVGAGVKRRNVGAESRLRN
jgi:hypothetical protein